MKRPSQKNKNIRNEILGEIYKREREPYTYKNAEMNGNKLKIARSSYKIEK